MFSCIGDVAKLTLRLLDIGFDWVDLSWDGGSDKCIGEPFFLVSNSTIHCNYTRDDTKGAISKEYFNTTVTHILILSTNVAYSCWVEAQSAVSPSCRQHSTQVTFTPGKCVISLCGFC